MLLYAIGIIIVKRLIINRLTLPAAGDNFKALSAERMLRDMDFKATSARLGKLHTLHRYLIFSMIPDVKTYPGQPPILGYLQSHKNCTQAELAEFLHVSPASVAVSLRRMQKAGLIDRRTDSSDLRRNKIFITELGKERDKVLQDAFKKINDCLLAGFSDDEAKQLNGYLDRLIENLTRCSGVCDCACLAPSGKSDKGEQDKDD